MGAGRAPGLEHVAPSPLASFTSVRRVGLLLESLTQPAWARATVEQLLRQTRVEFAVVAVAPRPAPPASLPSKLAALRSHGLAAAFDRLDAELFCREPDPFATRSISPFVEGMPKVTSSFLRTNGRWTLPDHDIAEVRQANLDVLLYLGEERSFSNAILSSARQGLWYFEHGSEPPYEGAAGGFWEVLAGELTVSCTLKAATDDGAVRDMYSAVFATHLSSVTRTRSGMYWTSATFPSRALRTPQPEPDGQSSQSRHGTRAGRPAQANSRHTANCELLRCLPTYALRTARTAMNQLMANRQWFVLVTPEQDALVPSLGQAQCLVPPRDRFWADPHVVLRHGRHYVFVEELLFATGRGRIAVLVIDESGTTEGPFTVLERPYHLSYPFVFEHEGTLFMIPETEQNRTVELYRCVRFPTEWQFVRNLMDHVSATDCTVLRHDDKWWLFTCMRETAGVNPYTDLYLFSAPDPVSGEWSPHPRNPLVSDERRARPAGPIFEHRGRLYRPAQRFVDGQGRAVSINEITTLGDAEYEEAEAGCLEPDWAGNVVGTHTLTRAEGMIAVDALRWRSRFA